LTLEGNVLRLNGRTGDILRTCGELVDEGEGLIRRHCDDCTGDRMKRSEDTTERKKEQEDEVEWRVVAS
jgi:predicted  nucleic acid-binding Zn-ribbon protein